jgi:hypothetical protein
MKHVKTILTVTIVMIVLCFLPSLANAQACDPSDPNYPNCVPIDGGLSLLIAAGVGYGIKKVRDSRKQQQAEENI